MKSTTFTAGNVTIGRNYIVDAKGKRFPAKVLSVKGRWVRVVEVGAEAETNIGFGNIVSEAPTTTTTRNRVSGVYLKTYTRTKLDDGTVAVDNNDDVAQMLRGEPLDECYKVVAKKVGSQVAELHTRFNHLNNGMQRMCLGNMLRKALRDSDK